eukprot:scaffold215996_cov32-Tisochrysis_lutea.AAC.3
MPHHRRPSHIPLPGYSLRLAPTPSPSRKPLMPKVDWRSVTFPSLCADRNLAICSSDSEPFPARVKVPDNSELKSL